MERMSLPSWNDFKATCIALKNLNCQYRESPGRYDIFGPEAGMFIWEYTMLKTDPRSAEQVDFEDNYKASRFNFAVGSRQYPFATSDYELAPLSASDTCSAGLSKSVYIKVEEDLRVNGGSSVVSGTAAYGDWIECQLVDKDNLLGYGAGFVLKNWIPKWVVNWKSCYDSIVTPYIGAPPVNMYFKYTYHSTGLIDVGFSINLICHRPI